MKPINVLLVLLLANSLSAQNYVKIGNPNNPPSSNGKGVVTYEYEIGATEVTNVQYCTFLNNVAASDPFNLYSKLMTQHPFGGIVREGNKGAYTYRVKTGYENKPIVCVTWNSAIRYINWLHYNASRIECGKVDYVPYTEGDTIHGAYNTTDFGTNRAVQTCVARNKDAIYWLPNENEWLKAAYFDPNTNDWHEDLLPKGINCYNNKIGWMLPFPHIKNVGEGVLPSAYGTYDQQGNAAEWVENAQGNWRIALGGSLIRPKEFAAFNEKEGDVPDKPITSFGFRVCRKVLPVDRNIEASCSLNHKNNVTKVNGIADTNGGIYVLCNEIGNKGDAQNQYRGFVGYNFYIGRYELTNREYCSFLNAVAKFSDPYHLYNDNMSHSICGGIDRAEKNGHYIYKVKDNYERKPVTYIHYCDLVRYVNWLHYGCPNTGKSVLGTTEGSVNQGAYNTSDFEDVRSGKKTVYANWGKRNIGAKYWIPSEDEWYKAAYYDPTKIGVRKYHDYPTRTSDVPTHSQANYLIGDSILNSETFVVDVDCFADASSYFGTQQQGGNVWEWTENWQYGSVGVRGLRGGSWSYTAYGLNAINMDPGGLDDFNYVFGGRICKSINETGWCPIEKPIVDRITEWWSLFSPMKIFTLLGIFVVGIICIIALSIIIIVKLIRHEHEK